MSECEEIDKELDNELKYNPLRSSDRKNLIYHSPMKSCIYNANNSQRLHNASHVHSNYGSLTVDGNNYSSILGKRATSIISINKIGVKNFEIFKFFKI